MMPPRIRFWNVVLAPVRVLSTSWSTTTQASHPRERKTLMPDPADVGARFNVRVLGAAQAFTGRQLFDASRYVQMIEPEDPLPRSATSSLPRALMQPNRRQAPMSFSATAPSSLTSGQPLREAPWLARPVSAAGSDSVRAVCRRCLLAARTPAGFGTATSPGEAGPVLAGHLHRGGGLLKGPLTSEEENAQGEPPELGPALLSAASHRLQRSQQPVVGPCPFTQNVVLAGRAACWYSWMTPPAR